MRFAVRGVHIKLVSILASLLLVAGCTNDDNSFRSLNLTATATLDAPTQAPAVKVMIVGDVASPRLADLLEVRGYDVTNVPYVEYEASAPAMAGDYIVWTDKRNGNFDIYAYQISTATEFSISLADGDQLAPQISGDYVVWEDYRNGSGNADIYAYRFSTATEFAVTTAARKQRYPQIDGDYIVWQDERNNEADIYAYRISSGTEIAISNQSADGEQWAPQINGDNIVWESSQGGSTDIKAFSIANNSEFIVNTTSLPSGSRYSPVLSEKYLVWIDNSSGYDNLYGFNLITREVPFLVSAVAASQLRPQISGEYVVWQDYRNGVDYDVYAYNFQDPDPVTAEIKVSVRDKAQIYPVIDGDYIAWQDYRNDNYDIYAYRISTGEEITISPHGAPQTRPLLVDGQITWLDGRRGLVDINFRQQITAVDQLATIAWLTPAGVVDVMADQKLVILGSNVFSDEVVLNVFDAALAAKVNVLGFGGTGTSLASALAAAGRYGINVTSASGCSPMRLIADALVNDIHPLFADVDVEAILVLESDLAVTMDELAIETDTSVSVSPADWDMLASFSGRMCNAAASAIVEFSDEGGAKVILDGAAGVADKYVYWSATRWSMFNNVVSYLSSTE